MKFIVYDIEATCWQGRPPGMVQETVEIGAVELNQFGEQTGTFSRLVKPILHPQLSQFCRQLTGLDQAEVNRAKTFKRVSQEFQDWIGVGYEDYLLCGWGKFDQTQLIRDSRLHRIDDAWLDPYINLRKQYQEVKGLPKKRGLRSAVRHEGLEWVGNQHEAFTDAENTANLFVRLIDVWRY